MAQTFQNFNKQDNTLQLVKDTFQIQDCAGNNIGTPQDVLKTTVINQLSVKDCNSDAFLTALQAIQANTATSNANEALITTALGNILTQVTAVNANTDTIEATLQTLITDQLAGNATLTQIKTVLDNSLLQLQAINANTDTVEALIADTNLKLDTLIAELDSELVYTPVTKFHIGTDNYYVRDVVIYNSETESEVSRVTEYSSDGVTFTTTAPVGTPLIGWYVAPTAGPTVYNINETQKAEASTVTLGGGTYHSVSVAILSGSVTIDVNGVSFVAPAGYSNSWEADTLLVNTITVTSASASDLAIIDTIK